MNYILSYPRSGSTWIRYCLEFMTKRPTVGSYSKHKKGHHSNVIGSLKNIGVDLGKNPIFVRTHSPKGIKDVSGKLVFLIRNYKEVIIRHHNLKQEKNPKKLIKNNLIGLEQGSNYMDLISFFDNYNGEKLIIYYEDLIENPTETISILADFVCAEKKFLSELLSNLEEHKKNSLSVYKKSETQGKRKTSHSSILSHQNKENLDLFVRDNNAELYEKYLIRYAE